MPVANGVARVLDDSIGTDLARIVRKDRHPRPGAGADNEWIMPKGLTTHCFDDGLKRRHHVGDDDSADLPRLDPGHPGQVPQNHAVFIGRPGVLGEDPPVALERIPLEQSHNRVCVPDVNREQHRRASTLGHPTALAQEAPAPGAPFRVVQVR